MNPDRLRALESMLQKNPADGRVLFALATEHEKDADWERVVELLTRYLALADDQGNAWGRLGQALQRLGRAGEARAAYARGVTEAARHGHPTMAAEFEDALRDLAD
jgi:E3 SUMO-protein ligase RanBP2